jgi:hypothetical protein
MSKPCDRLPEEAIRLFVKNDEQGTQQQCMNMALLCFRYRAMLHPFELCGIPEEALVSDAELLVPLSWQKEELSMQHASNLYQSVCCFCQAHAHR